MISYSGLAIFGLKYPSLLDYDRKRFEDAIADNLRDLYHVNILSSDIYIKEPLDEVNPDYLCSAFTKIFASLQRGKVLEVCVHGWTCDYIRRWHRTLSSNNVSCPHCCKKEHSNGSVSTTTKCLEHALYIQKKRMLHHYVQK